MVHATNAESENRISFTTGRAASSIVSPSPSIAASLPTSVEPPYSRYATNSVLSLLDTVVKQQLEVIAMSNESRLSQFVALQALSRLGLLTPETQAVIEQLAVDETWGPIAALIET